jgi:hypothetical protein
MAKLQDAETAVGLLATQHEGVERGVACAGTALESTTYRVGKKAFLFVRKGEIRLKLGASLEDARKRGHEVGKQGWVKIVLKEGAPPGQLDAWIAESYRLMAPKPKGSVKRPA